MKKILSSAFTILALAAVVAGGTQAVFVDTETVTGNTFAAGTLDLKTNNSDGATASYTLTNIRPGAWDLAGQVILKNAGTTKGHAWLEITNVSNFENTCIEPEDGDGTCADGADQGELGGLVKASFQQNVAPWTRFGGTSSINVSAGTRVDLFDLDADASMPLVVYGVWPNGGATDNVAQSDSVTFDVVFHLDQI